MSDDDSDSTIELNRRRVLAGLGTIGVASAGAGAGTMALFSDTEESTGNTVQAGTLDLEVGESSADTFSADPIAPGEDAGSVTIDLTNDGSIDADHVEFAASITGEGSEATEPDDNNDTDVSDADFAKRVFAEDLTWAGSPVNWDASVFPTLVDNPGAVVFDDMTLDRVDDPNGSGTVLKAEGTGYGISMRSVSSIELGDVELGDLTLDWYASSNNVGSAPDEIFAVIDDEGTRRLVYHTANYDPDNNTVSDQSGTLDIGQEMGLAGDADNAYNTNYNWTELSPENNTYPDPRTGLTGDPANDGQAGSEFPQDATIEALGFGLGNFGESKQKEAYYDDLTVDGASYELRPLSLFDIAERGVANDLEGLASDAEKSFSASFYLDPAAGNKYQADGAEAKFEFGLAQESDQDVL